MRYCQTVFYQGEHKSFITLLLTVDFEAKNLHSFEVLIFSYREICFIHVARLLDGTEISLAYGIFMTCQFPHFLDQKATQLAWGNLAGVIGWLRG